MRAAYVRTQGISTAEAHNHVSRAVGNRAKETSTLGDRKSLKEKLLHQTQFGGEAFGVVVDALPQVSLDF
jgi:hypothetical protein